MQDTAKKFIHDLTAIVGSVIFFACGILLSLGYLPGHTSILSRAGGVVLAVLFFFIALQYILKFNSHLKT